MVNEVSSPIAQLPSIYLPCSPHMNANIRLGIFLCSMKSVPMFESSSDCLLRCHRITNAACLPRATNCRDTGAERGAGQGAGQPQYLY